MPGNRPSYARTIVESELVTARINAAIKRADHLEGMWNDALKWKLARKPESGNQIDDKFYYAKTFAWKPGGVPSITVLYWFDDNNVYIESSKIDWPQK